MINTYRICSGSEIPTQDGFIRIIDKHTSDTYLVEYVEVLPAKDFDGEVYNSNEQLMTAHDIKKYYHEATDETIRTLLWIE